MEHGQVSLHTVNSSVVGLNVHNQGDTNFTLHSSRPRIGNAIVANPGSSVNIHRDVNFVNSQNDRRAIVTWLERVSTLNFRKHGEDFLKLQKTYKDAGTRILVDPEFRAWTEGENGSLWCYGKAGTGKTTSVSSVMYYFEDMCNRKQIRDFAYRGWACVYFNQQERANQSLRNILANILSQLIRFHESCSRQVLDMYEYYHDEPENLSSQYLMERIQEETQRFREVYLIFDGLDQCPNETTEMSQETFTRAIYELKHVKFMFTSWDDDNIRQALRPDRELCISATEDDLAMYIKGQIEGCAELSYRLAHDYRSNPRDFTRLCSAITHKAKGSFLLVRMQLDTIASVRTTADGQSTSLVLPQTHSEFYSNHGMARIQNQPANYVSQGKQILGWVCFAARPLTAVELFSLIGIPYESQQSADRLLTTRCGGLLLIGEDGTVALFHQTLRSFLKADGGIQAQDMHAEISLNCIEHLLGLDDELFDPASAQVNKIPGLKYAADFWGYHVQRTKRKDAWKRAQVFLQDLKRLNLARWLMSDALISEERMIYGLHLAVYFGSRRLVSEFLASPGANLNITTHLGNTPLQWAVRFRHSRIVETLISYGSDPNEVDGRGKTPLHWAVEIGEQKAAELLVRNTHLSAEDRESFTPLRRAARDGTLWAVKLLLDHREEVIDEEDSDGFTPLRLAVQAGHMRVVRLLIQRGAKLEPAGDHGWSFLCFAAREGLEWLVKCLIDKKVNLNQVDAQHKTALQLAFDHERKAVAWHLINACANPNVKDDSGFTILHNFVLHWGSRKEKSLLWLLLQSDIDVDQLDDDGMTAMHHATNSHNLEVLWLLVERGANPNVTNHQGRSVLHTAAQQGQVATMFALLQSRCQLDLQDNNGQTPLHIAMEKGHWQVAGLLLQGNANPSLQCQYLLTPLHIGTSRAPPFLLHHLVDKHADMTLQDKRGLNPLHLAVHAKNAQSTEVLAQRSRPHVDLLSAKGWSALHMAAAKGHLDLVDILVRAAISVPTSTHKTTAAKHLCITPHD
ncbi:hypothetical protein JX266_002057 [Neoarthrinium moseri]|nr:hypothetical protein JX266_002057 [Neoarthrinium moseri]